jgi:hypothetical protein
MYAGEAFAESVRAYRGLVERAAAASDDATQARMARHFYKGCELEWMFWDAALQTQVRHGIRVRVEIMGAVKYENVEKSQSVLTMINPIIFTRIRILCHLILYKYVRAHACGRE